MEEGSRAGGGVSGPGELGLASGEGVCLNLASGPYFPRGGYPEIHPVRLAH